MLIVNTSLHTMVRRAENTPLLHFSSFKRPNMLSLDRFQSYFNSLKSETKSPFTSLTAGRFYVFLLLLPTSKRFHSTQSRFLGELQVWSPSKHRGNNSTGAAGMGVLGQSIGVQERSHPFLKLQKGTTTKGLRGLISHGVSVPLGIETYQNVIIFNIHSRQLK